MPRPENPEDEIVPDAAREIGRCWRIRSGCPASGDGDPPIGAGDRKPAAAIADGDRRLAGRVAELRLVVPLREHAADVVGQVEVRRDQRAEAVPDLLVPDDVVGVAQLGAVSLRDVVAGPKLEAAGAAADAHHIRLDRGGMRPGEALDAPAVERPALEIEMDRLERGSRGLA